MFNQFTIFANKIPGYWFIFIKDSAQLTMSTEDKVVNLNCLQRVK